VSKLIQRKAARISAADVQTFTIQGIERALAARCAVTELTPDQLEQVSGAAVAQKEVFVLSGARPPFPDPFGKDPVISRD
jgi:hypothetical protein